MSSTTNGCPRNLAARRRRQFCGKRSDLPESGSASRHPEWPFITAMRGWPPPPSCSLHQRQLLGGGDAVLSERGTMGRTGREAMRRERGAISSVRESRVRKDGTELVPVRAGDAAGQQDAGQSSRGRIRAQVIGVAARADDSTNGGAAPRSQVGIWEWDSSTTARILAAQGHPRYPAEPTPPLSSSRALHAGQGQGASTRCAPTEARASTENSGCAEGQGYVGCATADSQ